jgi:hypothetical protein
MAEIVRSATASLASTLVSPEHIHSYLIAGEDLDPFEPCYIKASDGKVYKSLGTTLGADAARVDGYPFGGGAAASIKAGSPVDLYEHCEVNWPTAAGLTPGKRVYLSLTGGTAGHLSDTATTGGIGPIGVTLDGQRILLWGSRY